MSSPPDIRKYVMDNYVLLYAITSLPGPGVPIVYLLAVKRQK